MSELTNTDIRRDRMICEIRCTTDPEFTGLYSRIIVALDELLALRQAKTLPEWQKEVGEWGVATFPNATQESCIAHLRDEANNELIPECDPEELADVFMLLLHLAHKRGINLDDVTRLKFERNKKREWGPVNEKGFRSHIPAYDEESTKENSVSGDRPAKVV